MESSYYGTLDEIRIISSVNAQDALQVIDAAINEISATASTLQVLRDIYVNPRGKALVSATNSSGDAQVQFVSLGEGILIDHSTQFHQRDLELMGTEYGHPHYLGLRILIGKELHFGWMKIRIREDHSLHLVDWAYESQPEKGILVGYVPEPQVPFAGIVARALGLRSRRMRNGRTAALGSDPGAAAQPPTMSQYCGGWPTKSKICVPSGSV